MTTELIPAQPALCSEDKKFAVCYARGSVFKREGNFLKVEKGVRTTVHRSLCLVRFYGSRCDACPNNGVKVQLEVGNGLRPAESK